LKTFQTGSAMAVKIALSDASLEVGWAEVVWTLQWNLLTSINVLGAWPGGGKGRSEDADRDVKDFRQSAGNIKECQTGKTNATATFDLSPFFCEPITKAGVTSPP
jgi:hypothetical protein